MSGGSNRQPRKRTAFRAGFGVALITALVPLMSGCFLIPGMGSSGSDAVKDVQEVKGATMLLVGQGTFIDQGSASPSETGWIGTGWFITPDGYAVTNNHVVTGAGTLNAFVAGPSGEKYSAQIVGASECYDLAVIKVEVPGPVPFLSWHDGNITEGIEVYSAGFPAVLGAEYTLTKGIVSQADTAMSTPWADVEHAIQHDARIRGGNSGGPLVGVDARVLGVNYAGNDEFDSNIAIQRESAKNTIEKLKNGEAVLSLGINARANPPDDTGSAAGIWVSSVKPGGAADKAGVRPGDIINKLNGVSMGSEGTVAGYCDVLRTHGVTSALDVEILRPGTQEILTGQINGTPIAVSGSFGSGTGGNTGTGGSTGTTESFVTLSDESSHLTLSVPTSWADVDLANAQSGDENIWWGIEAAKDLAGYQDNFDHPGVSFFARPVGGGTVTPETLQADVHSWAPGLCTVDEVGAAFSDGFATGKYNFYSKCGESGADFVTLALLTDDGKFNVYLAIQMVSDFDRTEVLQKVLESYMVE